MGEQPSRIEAARSQYAPGCMIRRNRQGREIWFDRWLWSYLPCHWKGWSLLLGVVAAANGVLWLLIWLLHAQEDDWRPFLVLPAAIIAGLILSERHSPSRSE
jgi:hypothetical protein